MSNIADLIESYILQRLAAEQDNMVELRRTDIADEISCAPSQISYVLNTRFTPAKGFEVESRRGLGGYIRIVQVAAPNAVFEEILEEIDEDTEEAAIESMVRYLLKHQLLTAREAALIIQVTSAAYENMLPKARVKMIKSMFAMLEHFS